METTVKKSNPGFTYGLMAGLIYCVITLIQYLMGVKGYMSPLAYIAYLVPIIVSVLAALKQRKAQGYLEYGEALKIVFTVFAICLLLQTIFVYILFNFVDVSFAEALKQEIMEKSEAMLKRFGASDTTVDEAMKKMANENQFSPGKLLIGYCITCIVTFLISLIIAACVFKKKPVF